MVNKNPVKEKLVGRTIVLCLYSNFWTLPEDKLAIPVTDLPIFTSERLAQIFALLAGVRKRELITRAIFRNILF